MTAGSGTDTQIPPVPVATVFTNTLSVARRIDTVAPSTGAPEAALTTTPLNHPCTDVGATVRVTSCKSASMEAEIVVLPGATAKIKPLWVMPATLVFDEP